MTIIFISGSASIKSLDCEVKARIDNIIRSKFRIILGDAIGVDNCVQGYLAEKNFNSVTVYCSNDCTRRNRGQWKVQNVLTDLTPGTRGFYTAKDLQMAKDCDYGFMIWDGRSQGTFANIIELLLKNRISLVYLQEHQRFLVVTNPNDLKSLMSFMKDDAIAKTSSLTCKLDLLFQSL